MNINIIILIISFSISIYGIIRNTWVFKHRMKILHCMGLIALEALPSYSTMMFNF